MSIEERKTLFYMKVSRVLKNGGVDRAVHWQEQPTL